MARKPTISIIIPCRNEEAYIEGCIKSVINNDYPKELTEVCFVDGMSTDKTREIIQKYANNHPYIKLLSNPNRVVPHALNKGVNHSSGDYVIRLDAHSTFPKNYFSALVDASESLNADNVGGVCITDVKNKTRKSLSIKTALSHRVGVGNSLFRTGTDSITEADTVPFGCFRRDVFTRFGMFDERLTRNQDIEFNKRIINGGGKIYLVPEIQCRYFARETYGSLAKNNYQNGLWNILTVYYTRSLGSLSVRHFIPMLFILSLIVPALLSLLFPPLIWLSALSLTAYLVLVIGVSLSLNNKETGFFNLFWTFLVLHFSYGCGSIVGFFKLFTR